MTHRFCSRSTSDSEWQKEAMLVNSGGLIAILIVILCGEASFIQSCILKCYILLCLYYSVWFEFLSVSLKNVIMLFAVCKINMRVLQKYIYIFMRMNKAGGGNDSISCSTDFITS